MTMIKTAIAAAALAFALSTAAVAQTPPAPAAAKPAAAAPATTTAPAASPAKPLKGAAAKKPQTPESMACSKDADAKNLHGNERKKFRSACMKTAGKTAKKS